MHIFILTSDKILCRGTLVKSYTRDTKYTSNNVGLPLSKRSHLHVDKLILQ